MKIFQKIKFRQTLKIVTIIYGHPIAGVNQSFQQRTQLKDQSNLIQNLFNHCLKTTTICVISRIVR